MKIISWLILGAVLLMLPLSWWVWIIAAFGAFVLWELLGHKPKGDVTPDTFGEYAIYTRLESGEWGCLLAEKRKEGDVLFDVEVSRKDGTTQRHDLEVIYSGDEHSICSILRP